MPNSHKIASHSRDFLLATVILLIAGIGFLITRCRQSEPAAVVEIRIDEDLIETLDLSQDTEMTIRGALGSTNHLVIKDGQVWIDDASCPDKVCIHQGKISQSSEMIVCLPNLMIAQIKTRRQ